MSLCEIPIPSDSYSNDKILQSNGKYELKIHCNTVPPLCLHRIAIITMMMRKRILRSGAVRPVPTRSVRRPLPTRYRTPRGEEDHHVVLLFSAGRPIQIPLRGPLPEEPHALFPTTRTRRPTTHKQR